MNQRHWQQGRRKDSSMVVLFGCVHFLRAKLSWLCIVCCMIASLCFRRLLSDQGRSTGLSGWSAATMAAGAVTFYTYPLAFNPAKVKLMLEEKGIVYTEKKIDLFGGQSLEPWFLKLSPSGTVPTLVVGDRVIAESSEIVKWVDEQGDPLGGDKVDRTFISDWVAKVDAWDGNLFMAAFGSAGGILKVVQEHKIKVAEATVKRHPDLAELYEAKIKSMKASLEEKPDKEQVAQECKSQLVSLLDEAESKLNVAKFLAGSEYSAADAIFTPCIYRTFAVKLDKELLDPRENVKKYWGELKKRPSYKKAFGASDSALSKVGTVLPSLGKIYFSKLTNKY